MVLNIILLALFVIAAFWTAVTGRILRSAIGLALVSVILSILLFRLNSPLAAIFELSVCAGLVSVLFISMISLTEARSDQPGKSGLKGRLIRFAFLAALVLAVGASINYIVIPDGALMTKAGIAPADPRIVFWKERHLDIIGQITLLLAGAMGVLILFREVKNKQ